MTKKLLLLLPLVPLSAIGIVEIAGHIVPPASEPAAIRPTNEIVKPPAPSHGEPHYSAPHFSKPLVEPAAPSAPQAPASR